MSGWWFQIFLFSIIYGITLPIDFHIFQDGWNHQPELVMMIIIIIIYYILLVLPT